MTARPGQIACFLLPWATGLIVLTGLPLACCLVLSFTRFEGGAVGESPTWVGTMHYRTALGIEEEHVSGRSDPGQSRASHDGAAEGEDDGVGDPYFYKSLGNSLLFTLFAVPLGLCTSLAVAMLLGRPFRGASLARACVYLPHVLGGVATIVIWSWLLNPQFGWVNQGIRLLYVLLDPLVGVFVEGGTSRWGLPRWLYSPAGCKPAVILISVWTMGGSMLIFLAALRRVPQPLYDAARLDGAGAWRCFRHITLPQIAPVILFNLIMSIIFSMQSFNESYLLANRQQEDGLLFYILYLYRVAFEPPYRLGYACALAWILFAVLFVLVVPLLWSSRRWVYEAAGR